MRRASTGGAKGVLQPLLLHFTSTHASLSVNHLPTTAPQHETRHRQQHRRRAPWAEPGRWQRLLRHTLSSAASLSQHTSMETSTAHTQRSPCPPQNHAEILQQSPRQTSAGSGLATAAAEAAPGPRTVHFRAGRHPDALRDPSVPHGGELRSNLSFSERQETPLN